MQKKIFSKTKRQILLALISQAVFHINAISQNKTISVKEFGAKGDGLSDDTEACQKALDSNVHEIIFTPGTYLTSDVLTIKSNTKIIMEKGAKIINNRKHSIIYRRAAFALGNMHPNAFNYSKQNTHQYFPCHDVDFLNKSRNKIYLADKNNIKHYYKNQFVWLRSIAESKGYESMIPNFAHLSKIVNITENSITILDPCPIDLKDATLSPIGNTIDISTGKKWEIVENVEIINPVVDARGLLWTRPGCYMCKIKNAKVENGEVIFSVNAFVKSNLDGLIASFSKRLVEIKGNSHNSELTNINGNYNGLLELETAIDIGEQSRDIRLSNVNCIIGFNTFGKAGNALTIIGQRIIFENSKITYLGKHQFNKGYTIYIKSSDDFGEFYPKDITLKNLIIEGSQNRSYNLVIGTKSTLKPVENVLIDNIKFIGKKAFYSDIKFEKNINTKFINMNNNYTFEASDTGTLPIK